MYRVSSILSKSRVHEFESRARGFEIIARHIENHAHQVLKVMRSILKCHTH